MRSSVLAKALDCMYRNCRNKTLSLTFYEDGGTHGKTPRSWEEFNAGLPEVYYVALVSAGTRTLTAKKRDKGGDRTGDLVLSCERDFDFDELRRQERVRYVVHEYCEEFPFGKKSEETGVYKRYEECLKAESSLFTNLAKLVGETMSLVLASRGQMYLGHYVDGKVMLTDCTDWALTVKVTDFYSLRQYLPEYEVVDFEPYPASMTAQRYLNKMQQAAMASNRQFVKG